MKIVLCVLLLLIGLFLLSGCSFEPMQQTPRAELQQATTLTSTEASPPTPTLTHTQAPVSTPTQRVVTPTATQSISFNSDNIDKIKSIMQSYGYIDPALLSYEYWNRVSTQIDKHGQAKRILALEFHGNKYEGFNGGYTMDPETFEADVRYLMERDYHFLTAAEVQGFVEGWLILPANSIILTTDSGNTSQASVPSMIQTFTTLEKEFGYKPQIISFIWTNQMLPSENEACENDSCWENFRTALKSGYFSFGSHTQSHGDFSTFSQQQIRLDLDYNRRMIKENLGVNVFGIAWPFEACPVNSKYIQSLGFTFAYGGLTRKAGQNYTYSADNQSMCLPRLFPPNIEGVSMRPMGATLEQMLSDAQTSDPLPPTK